MKKEIQVRAYTRKTKSGKTITVKAHSANRDSAEDVAKEALQSKKGSGKELMSKRTTKKEPEIDWSSTDGVDKKTIQKFAKTLGLSNKETISWMVGPNYKGYKESHLAKGDRAALKFLGAKRKDFDLSGSDIVEAVRNKINPKKPKVTKKSQRLRITFLKKKQASGGKLSKQELKLVEKKKPAMKVPSDITFNIHKAYSRKITKKVKKRRLD